MIELIKTKIADWKRGADNLQERRTALEQEIAEVDAALMRNIGAIAGAEELLAALPPEDTAPPETNPGGSDHG